MTSIFFRINVYISCEHAVEAETLSCTHSIQQLYVESDGQMYQAVTRLKNSTDTIMKIR